MSTENLVGQTVAGKYRVEKVLGTGGMGFVVGARHLGLDEPVAIKVLRPAMLEVAGMVPRFLREARAASKIKSEHVVRVTDVDTLDDGRPYMVMEHLEGIDFFELRKQRGSFGVSESVGYILQACDAIAEAHTLGIIHRDLKPSNLFLQRRRDGREMVKVLDFGISKIDSPGEPDTTKTGQLMGSPKYMSPEQMLSMRDVDARSDIWSLGSVLFEFLCGRPPFVADTTPRICALVLNSEPPLPSTLRPDLPPGLEVVVMRCLEKDPDRRFASAKALAEALAPFGPQPEVSASLSRVALPLPSPPPSSLGASVAPWDATRYVGPKKARLSRRLLTVVVAVAFLTLGIGTLYATRGSPPAMLDASASQAPTLTTATSASPTTEPSAMPSTTAKVTSVDDLPDLPGTGPIGSARALPWPSSNKTWPAKKPKPMPTVDPFGGRRN